jgi:hypothetical protein
MNNLEEATCIGADREQTFINEQILEEEREGRCSTNFGPNLLPGMYSTPVLAVPKPHSEKLRLVNHMSAGKFSQNSMTDKQETKGARLDTLHNFMAALLQFRKEHPGVRLVAWKSDIKGAFRLLPLHPLWQVKQIITTNYPTRAQSEAGVSCGTLQRRVDWRCCFGSCGSPRIWCSFMGLVLWIAIYVFLIELIWAYMDDTFGWEIEGNLTYYEPYDALYPTKQVQFLRLLDLLRIPHSKEKQLWGSTLVIIGYDVDPNAMTVTMPTESKQQLVQHVRDFLLTSSRKRPLLEWQQLAGWMS